MKKTGTRRDGLWVFFVLAFAVPWGLGALYALFPKQWIALFGNPSGDSPMFMIAVWAPTYVGLIVAAVTSGGAGILDLLSRLVRWRVHWRWYALATLGIFVLSYGAQELAAMFSGAPPPVFSFNLPSLLAIGASGFILDPGPLGEELGWRGFALPRLEQRFSGLISALILGAIWGCWHLPAFFISGLPQASLSLWAFMITIISLSVMIAWLVNNAGGSVIVSILAHWASNRFALLVGAYAPWTAGVYALAALVVIAFAGRDLGAARMPAPGGTST